jgi:hypothetical protein
MKVFNSTDRLWALSVSRLPVSNPTKKPMRVVNGVHLG